MIELHESLLNRRRALRRLVELDKRIYAELQQTDPASVFPNSAARTDFPPVLDEADVIFKNGQIDQSVSSAFVHSLMLLNIPVLFRMELEPTEDVFPGRTFMEELRAVLYSTHYVVRDSSGEYLMAMLGPRGLTENDVKHHLTRMSHLIAQARLGESPHEVRHRILHGAVTSGPNRQANNTH